MSGRTPVSNMQLKNIFREQTLLLVFSMWVLYESVRSRVTARYTGVSQYSIYCGSRPVHLQLTFSFTVAEMESALSLGWICTEVVSLIIGRELVQSF